jgi:hypothetical protein
VLAMIAPGSQPNGCRREGRRRRGGHRGETGTSRCLPGHRRSSFGSCSTGPRARAFRLHKRRRRHRSDWQASCTCRRHSWSWREARAFRDGDAPAPRGCRAVPYGLRTTDEGQQARWLNSDALVPHHGKPGTHAVPEGIAAQATPRRPQCTTRHKSSTDLSNHDRIRWPRRRDRKRAKRSLPLSRFPQPTVTSPPRPRQPQYSHSTELSTLRSTIRWEIQINVDDVFT